MPSPDFTKTSGSLTNNGVTSTPLIVVLGATAVGKSEIAIRLAQRMDGEIVSADSRLLYRGMDIGTAKPTMEERERVPHHLIDVANPDKVWSLASFQQAAFQAINDIHSRERLPFLVGGTGQYIRAVIEDWNIPKVKPDAKLRTALDSWANGISAEGLHNRLIALDPIAAKRIDPRNVRRTIRALEVILITGRRFSDQRRKGSSSYQILLLGLTRPRKELYKRIDARIHTMLENGLVEEVQAFLERGYSPAMPTFSAIGYREIITYLQGGMSLDEAVAQMKKKTRVFVRRQSNWFKFNDANIRWFMVGSKTISELEATIRHWLSKSVVNIQA